MRISGNQRKSKIKNEIEKKNNKNIENQCRLMKTNERNEKINENQRKLTNNLKRISKLMEK